MLETIIVSLMLVSFGGYVIFSERQIKSIKKTHGLDFVSLYEKINNDLYYLRKEVLNIYLNGESTIIPEIIVEAKDRGFFQKDAEMLINGRLCKFVKVVELSQNTIKILVEGDFEKIGIYPQKNRVFTIYKDGLWAEIDKSEIKSKHDVLR